LIDSTKPVEKSDFQSKANKQKIKSNSPTVSLKRTAMPLPRGVPATTLQPTSRKLYVPRYILVPTRYDMKVKQFKVTQESMSKAAAIAKLDENNVSTTPQPLSNRKFVNIAPKITQSIERPKPAVLFTPDQKSSTLTKPTLKEETSQPLPKGRWKTQNFAFCSNISDNFIFHM